MRVEIPCVLDPKKDCSDNCQLNRLSTEAFKKFQLSNPSITSLREFMRNDKSPQAIFSRRQWATTLQGMDRIEACEYYPESDITQQQVGGPGLEPGTTSV